MGRSQRAAGFVAVLVAAFCVSLSNVSAPFVFEAGGDALTILVLRNVGFLVLCGLWLRAQGRFRWLDWRRQAVSLAAGTSYTLGAGSLLLSFVYLPVSLAIVVFFTFPLMTALIECAVARRAPGIAQFVCLAAALAGLAIALEVEAFSFDPLGLVLAALAALGIAVSYVATHRGLAGVDSAVMTFHMAITGLLVAGVLTLATGGPALPGESTLGWLALLAAVLSFAGAFFAMFRGVHLIGAAPTAMLMNLEPVFTIALSVMLLSESLTGRRLAGAAVVILAVVAAQILGGRRAAASTV